MKTKIDKAFIKQVYRTSAFIWAFGVVVCLRLGRYDAAIGWTLGSAISMAVLRSLEVVVRASFVPGNERARGALAKFSIAKLLVVTVLLSGVVLLGGKNFTLIMGFVVGLVLTQAVIFLKVLGVLIIERLNG
ncbi:MAG: hypothetical protein M1133_11560 [Armatimonadetes bacterium]|nr:hypothetical protein [Armatimonadota bacterium]